MKAWASIARSGALALRQGKAAPRREHGLPWPGQKCGHEPLVGFYRPQSTYEHGTIIAIYSSARPEILAAIAAKLAETHTIERVKNGKTIIGRAATAFDDMSDGAAQKMAGARPSVGFFYLFYIYF